MDGAWFVDLYKVVRSRLVSARITGGYTTPTMLFTKKPALQPSQQRLKKAAVKRVIVAKTKRAEFIVTVASTKATPETELQAGRLVEQVREAKRAPFLQQYRRVTG
jgi:hypothetical protein